MNNIREFTITDQGTVYPCEYCSSDSCKTFHQGKCPKVKSIEYYPNGTIKKVEFHVESKGAEW